MLEGLLRQGSLVGKHVVLKLQHRGGAKRILGGSEGEAQRRVVGKERRREASRRVSHVVGARGYAGLSMGRDRVDGCGIVNGRGHGSEVRHRLEGQEFVGVEALQPAHGRERGGIHLRAEKSRVGMHARKRQRATWRVRLVQRARARNGRTFIKDRQYSSGAGERIGYRTG